MMDSNTFSFNLDNSKSPKTVVEQYLENINNATRGYVNGEIKAYSGMIYPYTKRTALASVMKPFEPVEIDIQEELGEVEIELYTYEVYLSVKGLPHYKYRLMFMEYSDISYPVTVVLNEDIVDDDIVDRFLSSGYKMTFEIVTMHELEQLMDEVLNSNIVIRRIQCLIDEAMRREQDNSQMEKVVETE